MDILEKEQQIVDELKKFEDFDKLIPDLHSLSMDSDSALRYSNLALAKYSEMGVVYGKALLAYSKARNRRKQTEAIAFVDKAYTALTAKGIKTPTAKDKESYVSMDEDVFKAKESEDALEAIIELIKIKLNTYQACHHMCKEFAKKKEVLVTETKEVKK